MPDPLPAPRAHPSPPLRFGTAGRFELQPGERRLLVDGRPASLGTRAFDLLVTLAARPDHLMTKSELLDHVWPGLVVEEGNLQVQISNLRKVLGGDVIATVPGRGYRFATALVAEGGATSGDDVAMAAATAAARALVAPDGDGPGSPSQQLFGRGADLVALEDLLQRGRGCVTLVGPAGVGKTSLARAAAASWGGGSVWVDLAPLADDKLVAGALARALGTQLAEGEPAPQLLRLLQGQALLLVLDNAEHVVQPCAELATLLRPLPGVQLLVTSQVPLAVAGERVQRLAPLALPDEGTGDADDAGAGGNDGDGALALLLERIVAAHHRFEPTPATRPLLRAICRHLDGLPLALEMAAARVPALGVQGVHDALAQRFRLLTRGHRDAEARHRSLHNALGWSYQLLEPAEQRLFRALGVFAGGFTLELATAMVGDAPDTRWDVIDGLATLVDRSLVVASTDDPPRYRLLETLRAFALEQLAEAGEEHAARARHAAAVLGLFAHQVTTSPVVQLGSCLPEMENAREAVAWARVRDLATSVALARHASALSTFTLWRLECSAWLLDQQPLMMEGAGRALPAELQAAWWTELARSLTLRKDARAREHARHAVGLWQGLQQPRPLMMATAIWLRGIAEPGTELDQACAALRASLAVLSDLTPVERLRSQGAFAHAALIRKDLESVLRERQREADLARELGAHHHADGAASNVVNVLNTLQRHAEAAERGRALLDSIDRRDGDNNGNLPWVLRGLLDALLMLGRADEAAVLLPRARAAVQRFKAPPTLLAPPQVMLLTLQRRFETAARLVGWMRRDEKEVEGDDRVALEHATSLISEALGQAAAGRLLDEGRQLAPDAAAALLEDAGR